MVYVLCHIIIVSPSSGYSLLAEGGWRGLFHCSSIFAPEPCASSVGSARQRPSGYTVGVVSQYVGHVFALIWVILCPYQKEHDLPTDILDWLCIPTSCQFPIATQGEPLQAFGMLLGINRQCDEPASRQPGSSLVWFPSFLRGPRYRGAPAQSSPAMSLFNTSSMMRTVAASSDVETGRRSTVSSYDVGSLHSDSV